MRLPIPGAMPDPTQDGDYAAEVYHGWKLLTWKNGRWHHQGGECSYPLEVVQWVGPLPAEIYWTLEDERNTKMEFDL